MSGRSSRADVRNPALRLPAMARLCALDPTTRETLRRILLDLRVDARARAEKSWRQRKPPMAAYWAAISVYSGHFARAILDGRTSSMKTNKDHVMENSPSIYGPWGEHPDHPVDDWKFEVLNGDTRQGYWEWVVARAEPPEPDSTSPLRH